MEQSLCAVCACLSRPKYKVWPKRWEAAAGANGYYLSAADYRGGNSAEQAAWQNRDEITPGMHLSSPSEPKFCFEKTSNGSLRAEEESQSALTSNDKTFFFFWHDNMTGEMCDLIYVFHSPYVFASLLNFNNKCIFFFFCTALYFQVCCFVFSVHVCKGNFHFQITFNISAGITDVNLLKRKHTFVEKDPITYIYVQNENKERK